MKQTHTLLCMCSIALVHALALPARAQAPASDEPIVQPKKQATKLAPNAPGSAVKETFTLEDRKAFYESAKLHTSTAITKTFILPGLGNFYAEQYFTGVLMMSMFGVGLSSLIYGLVADLNDATALGTVFLFGSYSIGIGMSYYGVSNYNRDLRMRYNIEGQSQRSPVRQLNVAFRF